METLARSPMTTVPEILAAETKVTREEYAEVITRRWQDSVIAIIDVGKLLIKAKGVLRGKFLVRVYDDDLPFGERTARIARQRGQVCPIGVCT